MESFEPMLKKSRGYDTDGANGMPWNSSSSAGNMTMNPGMNLSSGVNYHSGPNPNQAHGFNPNAAGANPNPNPTLNPNPGANEVVPGPPQGGYAPAMGGGPYGGGSGGSYGGGSYGGGSYENGNHSTHFEGVGFQQQHQQGSNVGDLECRRYKTDEGCPYGLSCRYKHGPTDERDFNTHIASSGGKSKPCMKFFSTSGCPYGEGCHFSHYVVGGIAALGLAPVQTMPAATMAPPRKQPGPIGDPSATVSGYKTRLCNRFNTDMGCRFGDKCHFAHGESDLRTSNNISSSNRNGVPMQSAPAIYDNGPLATVSNPAGFVDATTYGNSAPTAAYGNSASTAAYGNSVVYSANTFPSSQSYAEPTPPGVAAANTPFVANYNMPVENSSQLPGVEGTMQGGPVTGTNNVQVY